MKSQYSGTCSVCQISWNVGEEIHYQRDPKVICKNEDCFTNQGGKPYIPKSSGTGKFTSSKFPITKSVDLYGIAEVLLATFLAKRESGTLDIGQQAIFIESMFKTLSSGFKE